MGPLISIVILIIFPLTLILAYWYLDKISNYKTTRAKLLGMGASIGISLIITTLISFISMLLILNLSA
jgi:hypothetical protein